MKILHGISKICQSAKGTMAILALVSSSAIAWHSGGMNMAYAGCLSSVVMVFTYVRGKTQQVSMQTSQSIPEKGMDNGPTPS